MKKNIIAKIGTAAVVLTMVTASLVGGTFAKYTSTVEGSAKATVAAWKVAFNDGKGQSIKDTAIVLTNQNTNAGTETDTIAPGSYGTIELTIDGSATEVAFQYDIVLDKVGLGDIPIKFYDKAINETDKTEYTADAGKTTIQIPTSTPVTAKSSATETIYWEWVSQGDVEDTKLGNSETKVEGTIKIKMTATQITEAKTETP